MKSISAVNRARCMIAFIISVSIVLASFLGVLITLVLPATESSNITGAHNFRYFTVLANSFMNVCAVLCIPFEIEGLRKHNYHLPRWIVDCLYFGVVNMAITFFGCLLVIAPINGYVETFFINGLVYSHLICPILSLLLFLFINIDHKIKPNRIIIAILPITIYAIVYCVNVFVIGEKNGGWSDHYYIKDNYPIWEVIIITMIIGVITASVLMLIHNWHHFGVKKIKQIYIRKKDDLDIVEEIKKLANSEKNKHTEGDIVIPVHIIDIMQKECNSKYTSEELYGIYLDHFLNNHQ